MPFDLALPLSIDDIPARLQNEACIWLFIPELLMIVRDYTEKETSRKENLFNNFTVEFCSFVKRNEEVLYKMIWTDLSDVFLKEKGKVQNAEIYTL